MPLVWRFVDKNGSIREEFIKFILCEEGVSGAATSKSITTEVRSLGLDMQTAAGRITTGLETWQENTKERRLVFNMNIHSLCMSTVHRID